MTTDPTYLLIPTASLKPYKKNSRTHTTEQIKAIMRSIEAFGFTNPVLVWGKDNEIVAGHARLQAAQALGMDEVPCLRVDYLTDVERKALVIADNKIAETGAGWDAEMLTMELTALADLDFDIALTGFDMEFLGTAILEANPENSSKDAPENDYENEDHEVIGEGVAVENPEDEWKGMPEFKMEDKTAFKQLIINFKDQEAVDAFAALVNQTVTEKTRSIWYPQAEIETYADKRYTTDEPS